MQGKAQDDDLVMNLVERTLAIPAEEREAYLQKTCGGDTELFGQVWQYVQWEIRMKGFLLDPLGPTESDEQNFKPGDVLDGRFRILREVAQGGMGIVYEAWDEKLERRIALSAPNPVFRKAASRSASRQRNQPSQRVQNFRNTHGFPERRRCRFHHDGIPRR